MRVTKEKIQEWVDALRSGEYTQTRGYLHNNWGYCCLGVLCEVLNIQSIYKNDIYYHKHYSYEGSFTSLPTIVWTSFKEDIGRNVGQNCLTSITDRDGYKASLAHFNDMGFTFDQIADIIEWEFLN